MTTQHLDASLKSLHSSDHGAERAERQSIEPPSTEPNCDSAPFPWSTLLHPPVAPASSREGLARLSNNELLTQLSALVKQEQELTVAVLVHLAEVELRKLHLAKGCSSLFAYCVQRLGYGEDVAYKRVGAARYGRRFPLALDLLAQGALHLSALMLVGPHLTDANHREWLAAASGKSKREVELLVATRCPKPGVPSSVRRLPKRSAGAKAPSNDDAAASPSQQADAAPSEADRTQRPVPTGDVDGTRTEVERASQPALAGDTDETRTEVGRASGPPLTLDTDERLTNDAIARGAQPSSSYARAGELPRVQPLSGSTYRVVFTASEAMKQKLDRARELCSHSVTPGDLPALLERALDLLIEREEKRRYAVQPPKGCTAKCASESQTTRPPLPRSRQEPDPVEPVESDKRPPESVTWLETNNGPSEPVEPIKPGWLALQPITSLDTVNEPFTGMPRQGSKPLKPEPSLVKEFSRNIPAAVRRAVFERDRGQCTFVDDEGNRCTERRFLEIDHIVAYARGGSTAIGNCRLLCRAHNQYRAKLTFGKEFMDRARSRPNAR